MRKPAPGRYRTLLHQTPNVALAILGALLLTGCGRQREDLVAAPSGFEKIGVQVTNHHFLDIAIYAVCDGQHTRIGVAGGSSSTLLGVPWRLLGPRRDIQLVGDAIGSPERAITEVIIVQPGQFIEWLLEADLSRSSVSVY